MTVVLQSASGEQMTVIVAPCDRESQASREALRVAEVTDPGRGWRVLHVL